MSHTDWMMVELNMSRSLASSQWTHQEQGGVVVITDMLLSVASVITNLVAISAIREQDSINMFHILLANLTVSNLVSSVLVKLLSILIILLLGQQIMRKLLSFYESCKALNHCNWQCIFKCMQYAIILEILPIVDIYR